MTFQGACLGVFLTLWAGSRAAETPAVPGEEAVTASSPAPAPPAELEGVGLGEAIANLEPRLGLGGLVAAHRGEDVVYALERGQPIPDAAREFLAARSLARMEVVFRAGRVTGVEVEYADRRDVLFDDMAARLRERYGDPADEVARGPLQVGRAKGIRLLMWLRIWTWTWDDRTLIVEGEHFGDRKDRETAARHTYRFKLRAG